MWKVFGYPFEHETQISHVFYPWVICNDAKYYGQHCKVEPEIGKSLTSVLNAIDKEVDSSLQGGNKKYKLSRVSLSR